MKNSIETIKDRVIVYTSASCVSCRKVIEWLKNHEIEYLEKRILVTALKVEEIKRILRFTHKGLEDIISKRSKIIREKKIEINKLTTDEAIALVQTHPSILRRPILIQESMKQLIVGFSEENIEIFLRYKKIAAEKNDFII